MARRRRDELRETVWPSDPHTLVKHLVYRHYLYCWMGKILQKFPQGATIVDAFAGPGVYSDGLAGSPVLVAKTYLEHTAYARFAPLEVICLERRPDRVARLRQEIAALGSTPKLRMRVLDPGEFVVERAALSAVAHAGQPKRPVLWLLDPFDIKNLPFDAVEECLAGERDEAVITFFVDEMHRFCTREGFGKALDTHFGSSEWQSACSVASESGRKQALVDAYCSKLGGMGLLTGRFGVQVRNATARYYLVFATHSEYGLECWNPVTWKLDSYTGSGASAASLGQGDLFGRSLIDELKEAFVAHAGVERTWSELLSEAVRLGFMEKHVREALAELAGDGLAFRVAPTKARTEWPDGCIVRFYRPEDADVDVVEPLDGQWCGTGTAY